MKFAVRNPCLVGVVTPEGNLSSTELQSGDIFDCEGPITATDNEPGKVDINLLDGTVLCNVPVRDLHLILN